MKNGDSPSPSEQPSASCVQGLHIEVKYSCLGCGLHRVICAVPARTSEDIVVWVVTVMAKAISADHSRRSPLCDSRTMSEVMVPITGAEVIGGPSIS